jgi:hypothetical protein
LHSNDYVVVQLLFRGTAGAPEIILLESWNDFNGQPEPGLFKRMADLGQEQIWKGDPFGRSQIASYNGVMEQAAPSMRRRDSVLISAGKGYCGLRAVSSRNASGSKSAASRRVAASARDATCEIRSFLVDNFIRINRLRIRPQKEADGRRS